MASPHACDIIVHYMNQEARIRNVDPNDYSFLRSGQWCLCSCNSWCAQRWDPCDRSQLWIPWNVTKDENVCWWRCAVDVFYVSKKIDLFISTLIVVPLVVVEESNEFANYESYMIDRTANHEQKCSSNVGCLNGDMGSRGREETKLEESTS